MFFSRRKQNKNEVQANVEAAAAAPKSQMDEIRDQIVAQLPDHLRERLETDKANVNVGVHALSTDDPIEMVRTGVGLMISGMMSALMSHPGQLGRSGSDIARAMSGIARVSPQVADAILKSVVVGIATSAGMNPKAFLEMIAENAPGEEWDGMEPIDNTPEAPEDRVSTDDAKELEDLFRLPPVERDDDASS